MFEHWYAIVVEDFAALPPWYTIAAVCISTVALFVTTKNYWRKAGVRLRGSFSIASSRDCDDKYVSFVILENLKDRAITIFTIYLRIGPNYYIQVEDFSDKPLLLNPYESYHKEYGPIQFYSINMRRIDLNSLLSKQKIPKRLVLSTSEGKYVVPAFIPRWNPISDFFRNHLTAVVHPIQVTYKDRYIGENSKFVVEFIGDSGQSEVIPIHPEDYQLKIFRGFRLTQDALANQSALTEYLQQQQRTGKLLCRSFTVHDVETWRARAKESYSLDPIEATYVGFFKYHVLGWIATRQADRRLQIENRRNQAQIRD